MRGFTLVEGLVAMFILTVVFFAAIGLYPSSVLANLQAGEQLTASALAQQVLEDVRMQNFADVPLGMTVLPSQTVETRVFNIVEEVRSLAPDVKEVQVTVGWTGHTPESVQFQTAIFNFEGGTK